ncbi:zinc finger protein 572-like [Sycon ciliatum]|uniref:zinc finger protein 572-like n=1 Tax=Sycon ciliatum TaxID=27933 RepID=UPI0031F64D30
MEHDADWTSESSLDSDELSVLPPLVIWTSKTPVPCGFPPCHVPYHYGVPSVALQHTAIDHGNNIVTSETSSVDYPQRHSSLSRLDNAQHGYSPVNFRLLPEPVVIATPRIEVQSKNQKEAEASASASCNTDLEPPTSTGRMRKRYLPTSIPQVRSSLTGPDHYAAPEETRDSPNDESSIYSVDFDLNQQSIGNISDNSVSPQCTGELVSEKPHKLTGGNLVKCKLCEMAFSNQSSLTRHERTHNNQKPFKCKKCEKSFSYNCRLKLHERTHSGEKTYKCKVCAKSFSHSSNRLRHQLIHTGEKPFKCAHCCKSFTELKCLQDHQSTHTGHRRHVCNGCACEFYSASSLRRHKLNRICKR